MSVDHAARRTSLARRLRDEGTDALLVTAITNVRYLTGFTGSNGQVLVTAEGDGDAFFTDGRYVEQAAAQVEGLPHVIERPKLVARVVERAVAHGLSTLGFEAAHASWQVGEALREAAADAGISSRGVTGLVEVLRAVKDDDELAALRTACAITAAAFAAVLEQLRPGTSERDVGTFIDRTMVDAGADGPGFETIVASGPHSAIPHHRPGDRVITSGDLVKLDFGARYRGYHADMTRTVAVGDPGTELRAVHDLVREAQAAGVAATVAGRAGGEVDAVCRDLITAAGHGDHFGHSTGHGLGLAIHESPPTLASGSRDSLAARMTVTVEPGVYLPGRGGVRIEDTVAVAEVGPPETLTDAPHELLVL